MVESRLFFSNLMDVTDKQRAVNTAILEIKKSYGNESIMCLGDDVIPEVDTISTGSINLDIALGKGVPRGRIVEIFGPESSGKTTVTLHMIAEMQKTGGTCAFIDAEHALDPAYAEKLGVNVKDLFISQPDSGEQALAITDTLVRSGGIDLIVIDSVAALVPQAEINGEMGDSHMGLHARLMSQALRKITSSVSKTNSIVIFINQIRMKIGVVFGNPETTTGGNALKFYASIRLDIRKSSPIKDKENIIGNETKVKVVKNKVAPPFRTAEFDIIYNQGICKISELLDSGVKMNLIEKNGSWYSYNGTKIGQGKNGVKTFFSENSEVMKEIEIKIREYFNI